MRRVVIVMAMAFATLLPSWALADDKQIAEQIIQKLQQQKQAGQLKGFGIDLQVDQGTVFMNGRVSSPEQQQMALGIAQRTPGVKEVVNGIKVNGSAAAAAAPTTSAAPAAKQESQSSLIAGWGSKKAAGREGTQSQVQQVANNEPIPTTSVLKKQPTPAARNEVGSGARNIPSTSRMPQSQLVAAQAAPGYDIAPIPVSQPMSQRTLQSQYQGVHPVARATMPGHNGPARPQQTPYPMARTVGYNAGQMAAQQPVQYGGGGPVPAHMPSGVGVAPARYDHPNMPGYAWPSYASYPNYGAVTYPKQYSPTAWPYIGPFYPYPQVPLGWRKVTLEWDDGWWMLDFKDQSRAWKPHR